MPRGIYERGEVSREASRIKMTATVRRRWTDDPEGTRAVSVQNGLTACSQVWRCDECGRVIAGPSIGTHQKRREHEGRTYLGLVDELTTTTTQEQG